jgi:DNA repair exonuclease SbcCD ATPase subunit
MVQSLSLEEPNHHSNVIHQLTIKLIQQEESYQRQLRSIQRRIKEKQEKLVELTSKADQLKLIYQRDLNELSSRHEKELNEIRTQHENELKELKTKYQPAHTCQQSQLIDQIMEKILIEFEQQEHSIIPQSIETQYHPATHTSSCNKYIPTTQSSYSKQYMPIDALSWPSPNARRLKLGI